MITYQILPGTTDVSVTIRIVDSTDGTPETGVVFNTAGIDLEYRREGAASTDITEATLAALTTAHTDGGFLHIGNGFYRLDLPDAACATGAPGVLVHGTVTGMVVIGCYIQLEGFVNSVYTRVGAPAGASVSADVAAVKVDTAAILVDTGTTLDGRIPAALVGGRMDCNVGAISSDTSAADNCEAYFDGTGYTDVDNLAVIRSNTAQAGAPGTITLDASANATDDFYNNTYIQITAGTGVGQARFISDYVGATKAASVNTNWITSPDNTSVFIIWPFGTIPGASAPTAAEVADAVWDEATAGHTTAGTFGEQCKTDIDAILVDTGTTLDGRIPAALVSGRMDASVGAMAANVMTAAAAAADLTTELQSGLATAAALDAVDNFLDTEIAAIKAVTDLLPDAGALTSLATQASVNTIDDFLDTEIAAIKAKTDQLTFTVANQVDANAESMNATTILGTGAVGDKWRG
jgi:hypothetical protein